MASQEVNTSDEQSDDLDAMFNNAVSGSDSNEDLLDDDVVKASEQQDEESADAEAEQSDLETSTQQESETDESNDPETETGETQETETADGDLDDPMAQLPEDVKARFEALQAENQKLANDVRANAGRVAGLNRALNEARKAQELQGNTEEAQEVAKLQLELKGKTFEEVESELPEVATYIREAVNQATEFTRKTVREEMMREFQGELNPLKQQYQAQAEREQEVAVAQAAELFAQKHPDFKEINADPKFHTWLASQNSDVQGWYESLDPQVNIDLLDLYKFRTGMAQPANAQTEQVSTKPDISAHAELPRRGTPKPEALPEDSEELFDLIVSGKTY